MLDMPFASAGWLWESANALGILALATSLYLFLFIGSGRHGRAHQLVSYCLIASAVGHVLLLWVPDKTLWHYAALDMPHYMWAGFAGLACILATALLALPLTRRYWHERHRHFKFWHYWLSIAIIAFSLWHISGSGFYFNELEVWALIIVSIGVATANRLGRTTTQPVSRTHFFTIPSLLLLWIFLRQPI